MRSERKGKEARRSLISGAQSLLCFPIPRSSANVDCGRCGRSRVFALPTDRVNTLIDSGKEEDTEKERENKMRERRRGKGEE